ncbi:hypothetical protein MSC49_40560 (plasmid) [Methylosinus sp. C49]|uniref:hypothetical protein n=1 Tax=Methylosinus sp. C49 TaxID=2699395 RepID=UPI00136736B3|nr:hypothetical protein [Methylosinus sp. C49]BBU64121.1 hypothetical protein MSC49_40560 [Methylosinus sp. C49]
MPDPSYGTDLSYTISRGTIAYILKRRRNLRRCRRGSGGNWVGVVSGVLNPTDSSVGALEGDHAITKDTTKTAAVAADIMLFDNWFDPIEDGVRERVRGFIETMLEEELESALCRGRATHAAKRAQTKTPPRRSSAAGMAIAGAR